MASQKPEHHGSRPPSVARTLSLGVSLILSALLTATALRNPALHWLAWFSLLPLFQAIRTLRLPLAAPAGGLWGCSVFLFAVAGDTPIIPATLAAAALLTTIPAIYTGLGALVTRRIGFNPFVLAVGWIGVELALTPLGLPLGIMAAAGTQGDLAALTAQGGLTAAGTQGNLLAADPQTGGIFLQWAAHLLGYVFIAFLVAAANASLLALLGHARLTLPLRCLPSTAPQTAAGRFAQTSIFLQTPALCPAQPRAPPQPVSSRQYP